MLDSIVLGLIPGNQNGKHPGAVTRRGATSAFGGVLESEG